MAIDLAQWRVFVTVAERGSLMQAAEALHTDQPALSRSLRRLERQVGGALFVRSSKGLTLTDLGTRLRDPVRHLVSQAEGVESQAHAEARRISGGLKIGTIDVYPVNAAIGDASRDLTVGKQLIVTELVGMPWLAHARAVLDRTVDVGFTLTVDRRLPNASALRSRALWEEPEVYALISAHHPLADAEQIHPRELADLPLHLPDKANNPDIYNLILELLADAGVQAPRRAKPLGTFADVIAHIAAGDGWLVSARTLAQYVVPGTIAKPLQVTLSHPVHFAVIWHVDADNDTISAFTQRLLMALPQSF